MIVYAVNGSPRKRHNTAVLLDKTLEGVKATHPEAQVERINLYDYDYTGCKSCFACKRKGGASYGQCAVKDGLHDVLQKVSMADGLIFGSPIYYNTITARLHAFYERLFFPYLEYKPGYPTIAPKRMPTACIYTMNVKEEDMLRNGYQNNLASFEAYLENYFARPAILYAFNTYQFDRYADYVCDAFPETDKAAYRNEHFPIDCQKAYDLGRALIPSTTISIGGMIP